MSNVLAAGWWKADPGISGGGPPAAVAGTPVATRSGVPPTVEPLTTTRRSLESLLPCPLQCDADAFLCNVRTPPANRIHRPVDVTLRGESGLLLVGCQIRARPGAQVRAP
ncbi:hypothetical protein Acsp07_07250 [Actinomycetospora sp. NBRC 106378]|nr:hypothetical protein Acsp07_07250 [Actinomycetospora sp. NBRC 106378]